MSRHESREHSPHQPVLLAEVITWLRPDLGGTFVDCTVGTGGHSEAILLASSETRVIGIDRDHEALAMAEQRLRTRFADRFEAVHSNFSQLGSTLSNLKITETAGVLADLGVSSLQLERAERGFSFQQEAPLDMRMDTTHGETAAGLIHRLTERELADLIFELGEERGARRIARAIVRAREREPMTNTRQLADTVVRALRVSGRWRIHPATRTFQALRIAVNQELEAIESLIPAAVSSLRTTGRVAIISFHSLEDRIVKRGFLRESGRCTCKIKTDLRDRQAQGSALAIENATAEANGTLQSEDLVCSRCQARRRLEILTRKPVRPSTEEVAHNPRARSARLRVAERL
jgi:16S rRNA (cytosine1402-N4)-methyltransferase